MKKLKAEDVAMAFLCGFAGAMAFLVGSALLE